MKNIKEFRLVGIGLALVAAVGFVVFSNDAPPSGKCGPYRNDKTVVVGQTKFKAEVVATKAEQSTGLSNRPCIELDQVMLFIFGQPGQYAIWMKEMKFPIDVLWVSPDMKVVGIEKGVEPSTYPDSFANREKNAIYVIEMKAGRSAELKVTLGAKVKIN